MSLCVCVLVSAPLQRGAIRIPTDIGCVRYRRKESADSVVGIVPES